MVETRDSTIRYRYNDSTGHPVYISRRRVDSHMEYV